jgi:hypothetical protein
MDKRWKKRNVKQKTTYRTKTQDVTNKKKYSGNILHDQHYHSSNNKHLSSINQTAFRQHLDMIETSIGHQFNIIQKPFSCHHWLPNKTQPKIKP